MLDGGLFTLVSALHPDVRAEWGRAEWAAFTNRLCGLGLPLVLYVSPSLRHLVESAFNEHPHGARAVRTLSDGDACAGMWLDDRLRERLAAAGLDGQEAACIATSLRALGWLHDESLFNPFGHQQFLWLHPAAASRVNPTYLQPGTLCRIAAATTRLFVLDGAEDDADFSPHPLLLGSSAAVLSALNGRYWHLYAGAIDNGQLPRAETLLGELRRGNPDCFARYRLQSNGLPGAFFDALREDRARFEYELLK